VIPARAWFTRDGVRALRPLGIALAWIALYVVVGSAVALVLTNGYTLLARRSLPVLADVTSPWFLPVFATLLLIGFGAATWLIGVRLGRHSWVELGWPAQGGPESGTMALVRGFVIGTLVAALAIALNVVLGGTRVQVVPDWSAYGGAVAPLAMGLLGAALFEELVFRGFPLRRLADALGAWPATLLLAAAFGLMHLPNDHASALGILNIALAGVWLSIAFFSPGGITLGWGLHFGWNLGLALLGVPVSGMRFGVQAVYQPGPHAWFDGGAFGPEGGVVGTIAIATGAAAILGSRVRRPSRWVAV
jgi:membrane protease YdiL (CAAX protease family)